MFGQPSRRILILDTTDRTGPSPLREDPMTNATAKTTTRTRLAGIALALLAALGTIGTTTKPADAANRNVSVKICARDSHGRAIPRANIYSYAWNGYRAERFDAVEAGPGGCGWVKMPRNQWAIAQVWEPAVQNIGSMCRAQGYATFHHGYSSWMSNSHSSNGFNGGTITSGYYYIRC